MQTKSRLLAVIGMALALAMVAMPGPVLAGAGEVLFLVDSPGTATAASHLYVVDFFGSDANLVHLRTLKKDGTTFTRAVSLASNYFDTLYFFDNFKPDTKSGTPLGTGFVGWYGIDTGMLFGFNHIVQVDNSGVPIPEITGAALDPVTGTLYAQSAATDSLYAVNFSIGRAALVGQVKSTKVPAHPVVNIDGADFAFDLSNNDLFLWTNLARGKGAPHGLYKLTLPASIPGDILATYIGAPASFPRVTGLSIDKNGVMYASTAAEGVTPSQIVIIDKTTGAFGAAFNMKKDGLPFVHTFGDLAHDDHGPITIFPDE